MGGKYSSDVYSTFKNDLSQCYHSVTIADILTSFFMHETHPKVNDLANFSYHQNNVFFLFPVSDICMEIH